MTEPTVLYDAPGPRARRLNLVLSVLFAALLLAALWWMLSVLGSKGQLDWAKWKPFTQGSTWTTYLLPGLWNTVKAALLSVVIALPISALLGIARMSDHAWIRWPAGVVVEFFRAIPVLILMLFAFTLWFTLFSASSPLAGVVIGLVLYNGSVLAEIVRAGLRSLPRGQSEAAAAIGLTKSQTMTAILLPQAVTVMLPSVVSQMVVILKDTALGGILVGYVELRRAGGTAASFYKNLLPTYVVIAAIYIALNLALGLAASYLERRLRTRGGQRPGGPQDTPGAGSAGLVIGGAVP
ncbi:glutamate transport system permease protein [Nakamurella panacisegetis]|uniref:Glutamate transport system permease protein n=1 Tax=Nakamurella panacisegetis TaxID=1090615 RepID=A0A1H0Q486_9ACTN|nr:amino acid ABC transporter permease [Nakamurella panacisegetis]SDP12212.1 glutamate transport system permease protein [Nakamurella panacisegetis]